jgi:outer membrane protein OmpA-like peptidoglycan-associated protein
MGSKLVIAITAIVAALFIIIDITQHGHFDPAHQQRMVIKRVEAAQVPSLDHFNVDVDDRTAIVSGNVDSDAERKQVTDLVLQVPGFLTVYNDLHNDSIDEQLLAHLKDVEDADDTRGEFSYRIGPEPHTVTLDGWVPKDKPELRDQLEALVRKIPGVRKVINNIGLGQDQVIVDINNILKMGNIYFDYNKYEVRPESLPSVQKIADLLMKRYPDVSLRIEGHTDHTASRKYNQWLSEKRAGAVMDLLVKDGVAADRLEAVGFGEDRPISPNDTPEQRANNRRIEFHVSKGNLEPPAAVDKLADTAREKEPATTSEPGVHYETPSPAGSTK